MSEDDMTQHANGHSNSGGLGGWLAGGLLAGAVVLGLLIAAYAVGYHRGERHAAGPVAAPAATTAPAATAPAAATATTATTAAPSAAPLGPVAVTPALVARGKTLFGADGCSGCHSLTGAAGAGPSLKGAAGRTVTLSTGQTVTADDAYLERSITDPDAQIVKGYHAGLMGPAIASHDLAGHPDDVRALVAFIKSQK